MTLFVFQLIIGLLGFLRPSNPLLAFFPFFGFMIGMFTIITLLQDGNVAPAYSGTTPINWSDNPLFYVPIALSCAQFMLMLLQGFRRL